MSGPELGSYFREVLRAEGAIIEQACEAALQEGRFGVLVYRDHFGNLLQASTSDAVPYGQIHQRTLSEATCDLLALKPLVSPVLPRSDP